MSLNFNASQEVRELVAGFRRAQHALHRGPHQDSLMLRPVPLFTPPEIAVLVIFSGLLSVLALLI